MLRAVSVLALAGSTYAIPACAPGKPCDSTTEVLDSVTMSNVVCGGYGDPHIARPDGKLVNHMGQGEYQLLSLPALSTDIHYFGCGIALNERGSSNFPQGTYMGALAIKIGDTQIEIVGNDLSVVGGASYSIDWHEDKAMGPFEVAAGATTVTIAREAITTLDLHKAQWRDAVKEGLGHFLYRWTVSTPEGLQVHSHAVPVTVAQGEWVLDVHVNYPHSAASKGKGLCIDDCEEFSSSTGDCGASSCMPINSSATYGVSPIFTSETSAAMLVSCPYTSPDKQCAAEAPLGPDACAANNISLQAALLACVHLSGLSDACYHDACVFDLCMGGAAEPSEEWYEEHNPPEDVSCKVVADPHFTPFSDYKFAFNGEGAYSVLSKGASGDADPCSVDIQTFECPGAGVQSYMMAVAITATGGEKTHEIVLQGDGCTLDGAACGDAEGKNVGTDGVTLVPYTPGAKGQPAMGDFGPGVKGWYVYAGGFKVNVTKTVGPDGEAMMNLIAAAPPMCTSGATGLCTTTVSNADAKLQAFAAEYLTSKAKKDAPAKKRRRGQQELLAPDSVPELDSYPHLVPAKTISGLNGLSCPASKE